MWQKTERKRFVSKVFPQYLHASLNTAGTKEEELRKQLFFTHLYVDVCFFATSAGYQQRIFLKSYFSGSATKALAAS